MQAQASKATSDLYARQSCSIYTFVLEIQSAKPYGCSFSQVCKMDTQAMSAFARQRAFESPLYAFLYEECEKACTKISSSK